MSFTTFNNMSPLQIQQVVKVIYKELLLLQVKQKVIKILDF